MDEERAAAAVGVAGSLAVLLLIALPYAIRDVRAVRTYYAGGVLGPWLVGLFAAIIVILLLAAVRRRSDPALLAGAAVVLGLFAVGLTTWWAITTPDGLVGGFTSIDAFRYHRWAMSLATAVILLGAGWYARAVL